MKKIICFLLLTVACTTNAQQKYVINGDATYGNVAVSIIINGGSPIFIGNLQTGTDLVYDLGRQFDYDNDYIEIKAESTSAYVTIDDDGYNYYNIYLPYFLANGDYLDTPSYSCTREAYGIETFDGQGNKLISCFISTLPVQ